MLPALTYILSEKLKNAAEVQEFRLGGQQAEVCLPRRLPAPVAARSLVSCRHHRVVCGGVYLLSENRERLRANSPMGTIKIKVNLSVENG